MSTPFCRIFSNTAATVATTIETKVVTIQMARKPAGSSSLLWNILMYRPAVTIKVINTIAQHFIFLKDFTEFTENALFCPIYPSNLNALYSATKNATDAAYPYKTNGSK